MTNIIIAFDSTITFWFQKLIQHMIQNSVFIYLNSVLLPVMFVSLFSKQKPK